MTPEATAAYLAFGISAVLLSWQLIDDRVGYVQLSLEVVPGADGAFIRTAIANDSPRSKVMRKVFLLVGPVGENPIDTFNAVITRTPDLDIQDATCCAKQFEFRDLPKRLDDGTCERLIVPLDYYFEENDNIGNEQLAYELPLGWSLLAPGRQYAVRFYVFGHRPWRAKLHRKVHRMLVVPGECGSNPVSTVPVRPACPHYRRTMRVPSLRPASSRAAP